MDFYHMDEESRIRLICKWVVDIVLVVSFAWFIVYAFGTSVTVSGNSMQPVLKNGDVVLMNRLAYDFGSPDRMDLVVFSRESSEDSRFSNVGNVKKEQIQGKAWVRISPVTAFGPIRARDTEDEN